MRASVVRAGGARGGGREARGGGRGKATRARGVEAIGNGQGGIHNVRASGDWRSCGLGERCLGLSDLSNADGQKETLGKHSC